MEKKRGVTEDFNMSSKSYRVRRTSVQIDVAYMRAKSAPEAEMLATWMRSENWVSIETKVSYYVDKETDEISEQS